MNEVGVQDEKPGFAERLKAVRGRLGLRQADVALELDLRRETVALIEVDHVASAFVRDKVRAWLEAREAEIAAADAAAAANPRASPAPSGAAGPRPRRRRQPPFNPLLATAALQRRAAQEQLEAEAAWRKRQMGRPGSLLRLRLLRRRRRRPLAIT